MASRQRQSPPVYIRAPKWGRRCDALKNNRSTATRQNQGRKRTGKQAAITHARSTIERQRRGQVAFHRYVTQSERVKLQAVPCGKHRVTSTDTSESPMAEAPPTRFTEASSNNQMLIFRVLTGFAHSRTLTRMNNVLLTLSNRVRANTRPLNNFFHEEGGFPRPEK